MNARSAQIALGVVVAIALFGGGFATGAVLGPSRDGSVATSTSAGTTAAPAARRAGGVAPGGQGTLGATSQATAGRVISVNDGSITVEVRQPGQAGASPTTSSTIALVGSDTRLLKTVEQEIRLTDIKAGDQVTVVGTADAATGTVSANAVLVGGGALQQVLGGQRGRMPGASPSPSPR